MELAGQRRSRSAAGIGGTIEMYEKLLEVVSELQEERPRALSARARLRSRRAARRLARDARQAASPSIRSTQHARRGAVPPRRDAVRAEALRRGRAGLRGRARSTAPTRQFYEQALYKHGWSLFKQQQYEDSLASFFALLDREARHRQHRDGRPRSRRDLLGDGPRGAGARRRHVPRAVDRFLVPRRPRGRVEVLQRRGARPYAFIVYTNLGDLYLEQERFQDAADAYHAFVELDPYHAKAPLLQVEVIEAFKKGGFADLVLDGQGELRRDVRAGQPVLAALSRSSSSPRSSRT